MEIGKIGSTPNPEEYNTKKIHPIEDLKKRQEYNTNQDENREKSTQKYPYKTPKKNNPEETGKHLDTII